MRHAIAEHMVSPAGEAKDSRPAQGTRRIVVPRLVAAAFGRIMWRRLS
jgi:hypothetical protein